MVQRVLLHTYSPARLFRMETWLGWKAGQSSREIKGNSLVENVSVWMKCDWIAEWISSLERGNMNSSWKDCWMHAPNKQEEHVFSNIFLRQRNCWVWRIILQKHTAFLNLSWFQIPRKPQNRSPATMHHVEWFTIVLSHVNMCGDFSKCINRDHNSKIINFMCGLPSWYHTHRKFTSQHIQRT